MQFGKDRMIVIAPDLRSSSSEKNPLGSPTARIPAAVAPVISAGSSPTAKQSADATLSSLIASRNGVGEGLNTVNLSGVIIDLKKLVSPHLSSRRIILGWRTKVTSP